MQPKFPKNKQYFKGKQLSEEARLGERAMSQHLRPHREIMPNHPLKPYTLNGRRFIDLQRNIQTFDQVEVDLLKGGATETSEKLKTALEESLKKKKELKDAAEHEGETGEDVAEAEQLIEELINKITSWLEHQFQDHALLIKDPTEIKDVNEQGDINLCVTSEFMNYMETNLPQDKYQFVSINKFAKKLEFKLPSGEKFKIVFVGKQELEQEAANNNDSFELAV